MTLWNRGLARASLVGHERTMNPSAAAHSILKKAYGAKSVARAIHRAKKRRRPFHRGNPLPALLLSSGLLGGLAKRYTGSDRYGPDGSIKAGNNGPLVTTVQELLARLKTSADVATIKTLYSLAHNPAEKHRAAWLAVWSNEIPPRLGELAAAAKTAVKQLDPTLIASPAAGGGGGSSAVADFANSSLAATLGKTLIQQAVPRASRARTTRAARVRQVNRYDPETGDKYSVPSNSAEALQWPSRKPSARSIAGIGGAAAAAAPIAAKSAGALGIAGASGAAVAGVVIGGLAVGALIGTGLRKLFGTAKAVRAEEASVELALENRRIRAQLVAQLGRQLTPAEARKLFDATTEHLRRLGFAQDANGMWFRSRTTIERILG